MGESERFFLLILLLLFWFTDINYIIQYPDAYLKYSRHPVMML